MSSDRDDRTAAQPADADASGEMESKLEQLDKHIEDAAKKAQEGRPQGEPPGGDPLDEVAGDETDGVDDPEGPVVDPP